MTFDSNVATTATNHRQYCFHSDFSALNIYDAKTRNVSIPTAGTTEFSCASLLRLTIVCTLLTIWSNCEHRAPLARVNAQVFSVFHDGLQIQRMHHDDDARRAPRQRTTKGGRQRQRRENELCSGGDPAGIPAAGVSWDEAHAPVRSDGVCFDGARPAAPREVGN